MVKLHEIIESVAADDINVIDVNSESGLCIAAWDLEADFIFWVSGDGSVWGAHGYSGHQKFPWTKFLGPRSLLRQPGLLTALLDCASFDKNTEARRDWHCHGLTLTAG
ncbi:uncharacterized protein TRIVIDRAFT_223252 [Trichoderma virens Gv29-8]|uniref:Uncharacterized protein n=1 Tax=Hypocrea virens (strain Gv29-8 / FGSC 10586) TaxID=413071 RepID=G9MWJ8_HYPVG|nr:uncharacterized protein TRIVIDRAFT_223252 [Trichoderma virens Gv29-8]EHK21165.1 hypothetical protein TRIVIDRAFT_223252 [Trichoderma virens Gv29-8]UKZ51131.1 hypothetical protein TrVGV298_004887 [Trichoderma virens]